MSLSSVSHGAEPLLDLIEELLVLTYFSLGCIHNLGVLKHFGVVLAENVRLGELLVERDLGLTDPLQLHELRLQNVELVVHHLYTLFLLLLGGQGISQNLLPQSDKLLDLRGKVCDQHVHLFNSVAVVGWIKDSILLVEDLTTLLLKSEAAIQFLRRYVHAIELALLLFSGC